MFCFWSISTALFCLLSKTLGQYVETIAGSGIKGFMDGRGSLARFKQPNGLELDSSGNIYVCDIEDHRVRKVSPLGEVTTLAGNGSTSFSAWGPALDSFGNIYVSDPWNNRIRRISTSGQVTTLSGSGTAGFADGNSTDARFNSPRGIAVDSLNNIYVSDTVNERIRKILPNGSVTTVAGSSTAGFLDGSANISRFNEPRGISIDSQGNIYVADHLNDRIRKVSFGIVSTLAGTNVTGDSDGRGTLATFAGPIGIKVDSVYGVLYVTDHKIPKIRKVTMDGDVTTVTGTGSGFADGHVSKAQFASGTGGVTVDKFGNIYVSDRFNSRVRKIIIPQNINVLTFPTPSVLPVSTNDTGSIVAYTTDLSKNLIIGISSNNDLVRIFGSTGSIINEARQITSSASTWGALIMLTSNNTLAWVQLIAGNGEAFINDIATSENGNVYAVGSYTGNISFTNQLRNLTDAILISDSSQNGFIAKYSTNGTLLWTVAIRGSPLYLTVETWTDSPIVTVKFAKQNATDTWSCVIVPTAGESLRVSSVSYGMAVVRFSPDGRILWSRVLNFAPWERNQTLSVSRFGDISLTGWCFLTCQLYEGNDTTSKSAFPSPNSGSNAVNVILSMNGTVNSWSPLSTYVRMNATDRFVCSLALMNSTVTVLSYGNQIPLELKTSSVVDVVAANGTAFMSINQEQRVLMKLGGVEELLANFDSSAIASSSCGRFDSTLGPQNFRGNLSNGTATFDMDSQFGFVSEFPFLSVPSDYALVRFRPRGRFNFRYGLQNETHALFFSIRSNVLETSLARISSNSSFFLYRGDILDRAATSVNNITSPVIALTLIDNQIALYFNGNRSFQFSFTNTTKFLFTTIDSQGSVDRMGIMTLPKLLEPWLSITDSFETTTETNLTLSSNLNPTSELVSTVQVRIPSLKVASQVQDTTMHDVVSVESGPTPTTETNKPVWTLFGLSGPILYIVLGASSLLLLMAVTSLITIIIVMKRRRRLNNGIQYTTVTFTQNTTNSIASYPNQKTANRTLINTEQFSDWSKFK